MNGWVFIAFTAFLIGHLWLFFRDRRMAMVKIASSVALLALIALLSSSFATWLGWPARAPERGGKYSVLAVDIKEPTQDSSGHIYAWLSATDGAWTRSFNPFVYAASFEAPRAVEIPFRPAAEKTMQRARQALREGHSVSLIFGTDDPQAEGEDATGGGAPGRGGDPQRLTGREGEAPQLTIDEPTGPMTAKD
jgi:hypothetical protein